MKTMADLHHEYGHDTVRDIMKHAYEITHSSPETTCAVCGEGLWWTGSHLIDATGSDKCPGLYFNKITKKYEEIPHTTEYEDDDEPF